jgi:hypothetical protein
MVSHIFDNNSVMIIDDCVNLSNSSKWLALNEIFSLLMRTINLSQECCLLELSIFSLWSISAYEFDIYVL